MSGCSAASSDCDVAGVGPPPPLTCGVGFSITGSPINVAGASGDFINNYSPPGSFVYSTTGGTPPYTDNKQILGDPSGKLGIIGISSHDTLTWTGFSLSEIEGCYIQFDVTDSLGATASSRYPATGNIVIKRTS